jgi:Acyl-CoA synthetase (NDP forming)
MIADKGVKAVIVTSAGFREIGGRGYYLEESIIHLAERRNLTLLGPNCLGVASWTDRLNASLISRLPGQGNIAFFSPSGSMCNAILDWAASEEIGFSKFASLGNRAVIDEASMLQFLAEDPQTHVIIGYLEGMNNGRRFARISQTITREKPVIMLQAGMTEHGQKAISSHVGALTGSERAYQTALKQLVSSRSTIFPRFLIWRACSAPSRCPRDPTSPLSPTPGGRESWPPTAWPVPASISPVLPGRRSPSCPKFCPGMPRLAIPWISAWKPPRFSMQRLWKRS